MRELPKYSIVSLGVHKSGGGPSKTIGAFKNALDARLFTFCDMKRLLSDPLAIDDAEPVPVTRFPGLKQFMFPKFGGTRNAERSFKESDLVSCHSFYRYHTQWVNRMFGKYRTPYWFVPHGILDPWVMTKRSFGKKLFWKVCGNRFLRNAETVIFSTRREKEKAEAQFNVPRSAVVPWPVDLPDISNRTERRQAVRKKLGIPTESVVFVYFGRLHSMKRPLETIDALAQTRQSNTHLLLIGNEQDVSLEECLGRADHHGVAERVHAIGPVYGKSKFDYLMAADAYVSLSHRENFNHTAAESLAVGLPVVLSAGNDLRAEIEDRNFLFAVDSEKSTAVAMVLNKASAHGVEGLSLVGAEGREWVRNHLSFEQFASRLKALKERYERKR